ncbi:SH3 domain-containing protein [Phormidium sp. CCY1219]|uniref:SH3 domain-containing protein n=1 Tax=Phormidium sp. CCY1219 TaxID=2886104 RepID=UPI002D1E5613|nr:SH3 domain-containing protein [Phormidium sp. CCY1219]MEB3829621.1 SH3 domain-containing protein [Phormidium sp. CCY1219]
MNIWQKSIATIPFLLLTFTGFATPTIARANSAQNPQLAQATNSCREVSAKGSGLYVRSEPTVYSTAIAALEDGRTVNATGNMVNGWIRISAPVSGYLYGDFISSCQGSPPLANCREAIERGGLEVRDRPSLNGNIIGTISSGRNVTIRNRGANGWVPIAEPFPGYVRSRSLASCVNSEF